ncbi:MAG: hypothetical protein VX822_05850 [Candidatus Neomarinimicrobiota bacterium]|nr:hypothetical protein [Candidatus Neomarinimicrobiota bacterium]
MNYYGEMKRFHHVMRERPFPVFSSEAAVAAELADGWKLWTEDDLVCNRSKLRAR